MVNVDNNWCIENTSPKIINLIQTQVLPRSWFSRYKNILNFVYAHGSGKYLGVLMFKLYFS